MRQPKTYLVALSICLIGSVVPIDKTTVVKPIKHIENANYSHIRRDRAKKYKKTKENVASRHKHMVHTTKWNVPLSLSLQDYISKMCIKYKVPELVAYSVMDVETGGTFNPNLISDTGDYGLFQINTINQPWLRQDLGITNFLDPYQSVKAGTFILGELFAKYGNINEVLLAYNEGQTGMLESIQSGVWNTSYTLKAFQDMKTLRTY